MRLQTIFDLLALARAQAPRSIGNAVSSYMYVLDNERTNRADNMRANPVDYNRMATDHADLAGLAFVMNAATRVNGEIVSDEVFMRAVEAFMNQLGSARRQAGQQWGGTPGW